MRSWDISQLPSEHHENDGDGQLHSHEIARCAAPIEEGGIRTLPGTDESGIRFARLLGLGAIIIVLGLLFARVFVVQAYKMPSGSMEPTLLIGDHFVVDKLLYGLRLPDSLFGLKVPGIPWSHYVFRIAPVHRGDVVVFVFPPDPAKDFIKRVIGIPGDTVQIENGIVWLNGKEMDDPHAHLEVSKQDRSPLSPRDNFGPVTVPPNKLLVLGDNRDRSYDSRFWGFVDINEVKGGAVLIYWSWNNADAVAPIRWNRIGHVIY